MVNKDKREISTEGCNNQNIIFKYKNIFHIFWHIFELSRVRSNNKSMRISVECLELRKVVKSK